MNTTILKCIIHTVLLTAGTKVLFQRFLEYIFEGYVNPSCSTCMTLLVLFVCGLYTMSKIEKEI